MALEISHPTMAPPAAASSFKRLNASLYLGEYSMSLEDETGASSEERTSDRW